MKNLSLIYPSLGLKVLVKIFELADLLEITPRVAAQIYLEHQAAKLARQKEVAS